MFEQDETGRSGVRVCGEGLLDDSVVVERVAGEGVSMDGESVSWEMGKSVRAGVGDMWYCAGVCAISENKDARGCRGRGNGIDGEREERVGGVSGEIYPRIGGE